MGEEEKVTSLGNFRKQKEEAKAAEPQPELIFMCAYCNCSTWRLVKKSCGHGVIECAACEETIVDRDGEDEAKASWYRIVDSAPDNPEEVAKLKDDDGRVHNVDMGNEHVAIRRTMKKLTALMNENKLAFLGGYGKDGAGHWWVGAHNAEERDWIVKKMEEIIEYNKLLKYDA